MASIRWVAIFLVASFVSAGCSDSGPAGPESAGPDSETVVQMGQSFHLDCEIDVEADTVECLPEDMEVVSAGASAAAFRFGREFVQLLSRNPQVHDGVFEIEVAIQNLTHQPIGTRTGTTPTGARVLLLTGPTNGVSVANADGTAAGEPVGVPYFQYPDLLPSLEVSSFRTWRFHLNGATRFSLGAMVEADVPDGTSVGAVPTGTLEVTVRGGLLPESGYRVVIDDIHSFYVRYIPGRLTIRNVPAGERTVRLANIAEGCGAVPPNPRTVAVPPDGTVATEFVSGCGEIQFNTVVVNVITTGGDQPDSYRASVGVASLKSVPANGSTPFTGLATGTHRVTLSSIPQHCEVQGGPVRSVPVAGGQTVTVTFLVDCEGDEEEEGNDDRPPVGDGRSYWLRVRVVGETATGHGGSPTYTERVYIWEVGASSSPVCWVEGFDPGPDHPTNRCQRFTMSGKRMRLQAWDGQRPVYPVGDLPAPEGYMHELICLDRFESDDVEFSDVEVYPGSTWVWFDMPPKDVLVTFHFKLVEVFKPLGEPGLPTCR